MADLISVFAVLIVVALIAWSVLVMLTAFEDNPLVEKMLKKNIKAILSWRPKKKNSLKRKSFTEYPLVMVDGMVFEILEATRQRGRIWQIQINMFNITEETRKIKLLETIFSWKGKEALVLTSDTDYTVKAATGLVSTSQMMLWSIKKPEQFTITYLNNGKPASVFINLTQEINAVKRMKEQSLVNKKEMEALKKNSQNVVLDKHSEDEKTVVSNETVVQEKNMIEDVAANVSQMNDEVIVEEEKDIEGSDTAIIDEKHKESLRKQYPDKEKE